MEASTRFQRSVNASAVPRFVFLPGFDEGQHLAHGDLVGRARQPITALGAAPRFDESALFQAGQNQLQKFLRDLLAPRDVGDLHRLALRLRRQIEDRLQGVLALDGNVHQE